MKLTDYLKKAGVPLSLALILSFSSTQAHAWGGWFNFWKAKSLPNITETVAKSGGDFDENPYDYDLLLNAVLVAGLDGALADPDSSLTVFAPKDHAFIKLANDLGYEGKDEEEAFFTIVDALTVLGDGDPIPVLTNVLLYHVSPEKLKIRELFRSKEIGTLLDGATLLRYGRSLVDNDPEFKNPRLHYWHRTTKASNGIIYPIDRVLIPIDIDNGAEQTITELVVASGGDFDSNLHDYDLLLNAVLATGLEGVLGDPDATFTVFAPNDLAFLRLARDLGYDGHDEGEAFTFIATALTELGGGELVPILTNVLLYHVNGSALTLKDVLLSSQINTELEGTSFGVKGRKLIDNESNLTNPKLLINSSNLDASNGRVHTINRVLIPVSITE